MSCAKRVKGQQQRKMIIFTQNQCNKRTHMPKVFPAKNAQFFLYWIKFTCCSLLHLAKSRPRDLQDVTSHCVPVPVDFLQKNGVWQHRKIESIWSKTKQNKPVVACIVWPLKDALIWKGFAKSFTVPQKANQPREWTWKSEFWSKPRRVLFDRSVTYTLKLTIILRTKNSWLALWWN